MIEHGKVTNESVGIIMYNGTLILLMEHQQEGIDDSFAALVGNTMFEGV